MKYITLQIVIFLLFQNTLLSSCGGQTHNKYNACNIAKSSTKDFEFIQLNAQLIMENDEGECLFSLLDTLTNCAIRTNNNGYLDCLEAFSANSDGYVSEYFLDIGVKLFYKDFKDVILYTFSKESLKRNPLANVLIEAMSMEISVADDSTTKRHEINSFITKEISKYNFTNNQLSYIDSLKNKFDPKLFD